MPSQGPFGKIDKDKASSLSKGFKDRDATKEVREIGGKAIQGAKDLASKFFGGKPASGSTKEIASKKMSSPAKKVALAKKKKKSS